jgi:hypothetical protein
MTKIIIFLALLVFSKSDIVIGSTHYSGIANVAHKLDECTGISRDTGTYTIEYTIFHRAGSPDSISFIIHKSVSHRDGFSRTELLFNTTLNDTSIKFLTNNSDSIVFSFYFFSNFTEEDHSVPFTDPCRGYPAHEEFIGITRISTSTAGVSINENDAQPIEIFPNPTNSELKIKTKASKAIVIDNQGRISMVQSLNPDDLSTLNVSLLRSGCYTLRLEEGVKWTFGKFIKY